ncbi:hypothetical protein F4805DRAFT_286186 [Annulohypoxylon moriforme]|nr:hypothetical protein F4805DRAFT_286186 [Annulohypoxylon moriforme]
MDPLTALSLAANIYAFLEAGCKAVQQFNELRRRRLIATRDNIQIRNTTGELKRLSDGLMADGPPSLRNLATECNTLCEDLLSSLDKLTIKDSYSKLKSIRVILNSILKASEISSKKVTLDSYRIQLIASLLSMLSEKQSDFNTKLNEIENDIRRLSDSRSKDFAQLRSDLLSAITSHGSSEAFNAIYQLLSQFRNTLTSTRSETSILMQLHFEGIFDREDGIKNATDGTFSWPFQENNLAISNLEDGLQLKRSVHQQLRETCQFTTWLRSGSGTFHFSGKSGSGKSTLMKRIWLDSQTRDYLKQWAGARDLCYAAFFFWISGNQNQRSLTGLYRSILFSVLNKRPSLIPKVFPTYWNKDRAALPTDLIELTRPHVVEAAFRTLLNKAISGDYCLCLFIDGLDEYDADSEDHWNLAKQLRNWTVRSNGNIKICISSRPHIEFEQTFSSSNGPGRYQVHLQHLNRPDIEIHCRTMFMKDEEFQNLKHLQDSYQYLVGAIVQRAEGVFLWAVLVVRIILSEARRQGTKEDLKIKLDELPKDMDQLYDRILGSLSHADREIANRILLVVLTNPFKHGLHAACLKWVADRSGWISIDSDRKYTKTDAENNITYVENHLDGWTRGLVELNSSMETDVEAHFPTPLFTKRAKLFHKTLRDYLLQPERFYKLRMSCSEVGLADLHAELRMKELKSYGDINPFNLHILSVYGYGYEKLSTEGLPTSYLTRGEKQDSCHISQHLLRKLASILPNSLGLREYSNMIRPHPLLESRSCLSDIEMAIWERATISEYGTKEMIGRMEYSRFHLEAGLNPRI